MPLIKEKRKQRGRRLQLNAMGRATQCITIDGNKKAASVIAQKYLADFPEVANWDVNVEYSQNKNNRWKIAQSLKDTFTEERSELEDEDMNVVALVVPDPNLVTDYSVDTEQVARYFMSNEQDKEIFIGKAKSRIPEYEFNQDKDVKFKIQDEALDQSRTKKKGHPKNHYYVCKQGGKGKKSIFYSEDSAEEDYYSEEDVEQDELPLEESSSSPKTYSLKDFLTQSSSVNNKEAKAVEQKTLKNFKGKIIFDPNMIQDIKLDEQVTEEEFETIEELDTSTEKIILFLDDIDPLASRDWETINDPHLERVTMINKDAGIILSLQIKNFGSIVECELKVSSLKNDVSDVLPLLSECKTIFDLSNMAQQLLGSGGVIRKSKDSDVSCCFSPHKAGINLLEIEVAKYEEETADDVISMDDHCNVCFDSSVQLDFCACGEGFCHNCWSMYLSSIKQLDRYIKCPGFDCDAPVPVSILNWYMPNEKLRAYFNGIVETSVKTDYNVHRCKISLCNRIVFTDFNSSNNDEKSDNGINCVCGNKWCRWCSQEYHYPSSCQEKQDFTQYESKLNEWNSLENTVEVRPCPKCGIKWEKMWGCNYMMCSTCGTGFCWGCGKVHGGNNGVCGKMNVPLERVEILPFPTEEFSMTRVESFHLYSQLKNKVVGFYKKDYDAIMGRFLSADKEWFYSNFKNDRQSLLATERGAFIDNIVSRALTVSKQGCISLLNTLLKKSNRRQDQRRIKRIFFMLKSMFTDLVEYRPTKNNWKILLQSVDTETKYFQKMLNLKI